MKKLLFFMALTMFLAACAMSGKGKLLTEKDVPEDIAGYSDADVLTRINDLKNGATPQIAPGKKGSAAPAVPPVPNKPPAGQDRPGSGSPITLENLAARYKSAVMKTNFGDITLEFYGAEAPVAVNNFMNLAQKGFYSGTKFHRVIRDFMIQGGDPNSKDDDWSNDGAGGPGYTFQDEINDHPLQRGSLAMANSGPNTNGSQFFIVTKEFTPWLDGKHTNFGRVTLGMDTVDKIEAVATGANDHPTEDVIIESIELVE